MDKVTAEARAALANGAHADLIVAVVDAVQRQDVGNAGSTDARQAVHDARRAVAEASQGALLELLKGRGLRVRSLWINNSIHVHDGTLALAEELAARADVREVAVDGVHNRVHDA